MPKLKYYDDVKIIKKPFKKRFLRFVSFFCIALVFSLCIVVANYFSSAITVSGGATKLIYGDETISKKSKSYFAVTLGEYSSLEEASAVAITSTIRGASGYIWEDNNYFVVGSVYLSREDAIAVIENLKESDYTVNIKEISLNKINLKFDDYDNKTVRKIENAIDFLDDIIVKIYNYSISFDKGEINNLAVSTNLSDLRGDTKVLISQMQNILNTPNDYLQLVQNTLIKVDQLLNEVILKTIDNSSTGYILKNTVVSLVEFEYRLYKSLE